jgi:hypothetical protein
MWLEVFPTDARLLERRTASLAGLNARSHLVDPFRFFIYARLGDLELGPIGGPPGASGSGCALGATCVTTGGLGAR